MPAELLHHHMADDHLEVLSDLHVIHCEMDGVVGERQTFAAGITENRKTRHAQLARPFKRAHNIRRIAAPGESNQDVTTAGKNHELLRKNVCVSDIVSEAGDDRRVRRQRRHSQSMANGLVDAIEKIIREVHGICRTATVAAEKNLAVVAPAVSEHLSELCNI